MYEHNRNNQDRNHRVLAKLSDGTTFLVQVDQAGMPAERQVSGGTQTFNFDDIFNTVKSFSTRMVESVRDSAPTKFTVELGFDIELESGKFVVMLVKGKSTAKIAVTLEWERDQS